MFAKSCRLPVHFNPEMGSSLSCPWRATNGSRASTTRPLFPLDGHYGHARLNLSMITVNTAWRAERWFFPEADNDASMTADDASDHYVCGWWMANADPYALESAMVEQPEQEPEPEGLSHYELEVEAAEHEEGHEWPAQWWMANSNPAE